MNRTLEEIDSYKVPGYLVERVAEAHGYSIEYAQDLCREAKRMLYLSVIATEPTVPSYNVDMAWHEMIIFTKWYAGYANFIGEFIHHIPEKPEIKPQKNFVEKTIHILKDKLFGTDPAPDSPSYAKTKENYKKYFGIEPSKRYWS